MGEKCTVCRDEYKNFSDGGCSSCGCDANGSLNLVCNKHSGQCPCKVLSCVIYVSCTLKRPKILTTKLHHGYHLKDDQKYCVDKLLLTLTKLLKLKPLIWCVCTTLYMCFLGHGYCNMSWLRERFLGLFQNRNNSNIKISESFCKMMQ